jgi:ribosomal protein S18 acetylase RimI-like enzyme
MTTQESELLESNRQFIGSATRICATFPGAEVVEMPGLIAAWGNTEIAFLNAIFLTGPVTNQADLERRAAALRDYLRHKERPPLFFACREWIPESLREAADAAFSTAGLNPSMTLTGMAADELSPARSGHASSLARLRVTDEETRNQLSDINAAAYGISIESMRDALSLPQIWTDQFDGYVAQLDGEAVATAAVMPLNGALHVMCVATMPAHQRRGYAEAVMRHSLAQASRATGLTRTTLHATEAGKPAYQRMGYRETATFTGYTREHA